MPAKSKYLWGLTVIATWALIIGIFSITQEITLRNGKIVLLKTIPIDPVDIFRGEYVALSYNISFVNTLIYGINSESLEYNQRVFVILDIDSSGNASITDISLQRPDTTLYIAGRFIGRRYIEETDNTQATISYGIENWFVAEGRGRALERYQGDVVAEVAIGTRGSAIIRALLLNGERIE